MAPDDAVQEAQVCGPVGHRCATRGERGANSLLTGVRAPALGHAQCPHRACARGGARGGNACIYAQRSLRDPTPCGPAQMLVDQIVRLGGLAALVTLCGHTSDQRVLRATTEALCSVAMHCSSDRGFQERTMQQLSLMHGAEVRSCQPDAAA